MTNAEIKKQLFELCKTEIIKQINFYTNMMDYEQGIANQYKGAMESRYDTFKEEAQARKDTHAVRVDTLLKQNSILMSVKEANFDAIKLGAVVETNIGNFFFLFYIFDDELRIDNKTFEIVSMDSALGHALMGKKINDIVKFNNKDINIFNIY